MIKNLEERILFWEKSQNRGPTNGIHDLEGSLPYPFEGMEYFFKNKNVLEIGPGRGRQYDRLKDIVFTYAICDISEEALNEKCFAGLHKYLLCEYNQHLGTAFDVIHFWYVLHHIFQDELYAFFGIVYRHLEFGGVVLFNTPQLQNKRSDYPGDGIGTTWFNLESILYCMGKRFKILRIVLINKKSTGCLVIGRKA